MENLENEKEIARSLRRKAISKNWKLFKQSRLGMVGLIIVGDPNVNLQKAKEFALAEEQKFATNKSRFSDYFSSLK